MKCHDAIRFISVYVDSELDPRTSFEIAEHLETCSSCAARFAREQELEKGLVAALNKGADEGDDQLWARVVQAVRSEPSRSARAAAPARRRFVLAAAVLALAVAGTLAIIARLGQESPPFGMLGKSACHSHDGYLAGSEPPDVVSTAPAEISSYVASKVGVTMRSPDLALLAPTGARCCAWGKTHVCFLMGRQGVEPVSAFVFPSSDLRFFPEARAALDSGSGRAYAEFKGRQVLLERNDRVTACVVASREAGSLEPVASALLGAP